MLLFFSPLSSLPTPFYLPTPLLSSHFLQSFRGSFEYVVTSRLLLGSWGWLLAPCVCVGEAWGGGREVVSQFPLFSSAVPGGDKYLRTSNSTVNDNPNRRCILKLTSLMGRWNHRAVSRTLPCQQAAGCCHVVTAFCLSGSAGKTRKCWCILLWIQQAGFSFLTTIPGRSLLPLLFHFSLSVFASMEWLPFLLPTCFHPSNLRMLFSTWPLSWVLSLLENILSSDCCTKTHGLNGSENNYFS